MIVKSLPTFAQVWNNGPKGKKAKLLEQVAQAMLFPTNQSRESTGGPNPVKTFIVRLASAVPHVDIVGLKDDFAKAGWKLGGVKYHAGNTLIRLIHQPEAPVNFDIPTMEEIQATPGANKNQGFLRDISNALRVATSEQVTEVADHVFGVTINLPRIGTEREIAVAREWLETQGWGVDQISKEKGNVYSYRLVKAN